MPLRSSSSASRQRPRYRRRMSGGKSPPEGRDLGEGQNLNAAVRREASAAGSRMTGKIRSNRIIRKTLVKPASQAGEPQPPGGGGSLSSHSAGCGRGMCWLKRILCLENRRQPSGREFHEKAEPDMRPSQPDSTLRFSSRRADYRFHSIFVLIASIFPPPKIQFADS